MKNLILEIPPAALYVIIAACAMIVISGIAVAVYLHVKKNKSKPSAPEQSSTETVEEAQAEPALNEDKPAEIPAVAAQAQPEKEEPAVKPLTEPETSPVVSVETPSVISGEPSSVISVETPSVISGEPSSVISVETPSVISSGVSEANATEKSVTEPTPSNAPEPDEEDEEEDETEVAPQRQVARTANGHVRYIIIKYNKSHTAKLIQSSDTCKNYYSELKNELLSYKGVKSRVSWKYETFYSGRQTYARLSMRGKKLCIFLALDPAEYVDTKYIIDDKSDVLAYEKTPLLYRIKNDRRLKYAKELIATVMGERERTEDFVAVNYAAQLPYEEIEPLIERKLVKVLTEEDAQSGDVFKPRDFVQATEVNELLQDDVAQALIEVSDEVSDRTKCEIINIDILSRYFQNDEKVTLEEIKKRVPKFPKNATYVKVLARGLLDKRLTVVADAYSIEAAKMILLTGGNPVKKS